MEYSTSKLDKKILKIKEEIGGIYIYSMNVFEGWLGIGRYLIEHTQPHTQTQLSFSQSKINFHEHNHCGR